MSSANRRVVNSLDFRKSRDYVMHVNRVVTQKFNSCKQNLIQQFNSSRITQEIEAGSNSSNISLTLSGRGNLFSFIGFKAGEKPTEAIREAMNGITLTKIMISKDGSSQSYVLYPSVTEIFKITPLPWAQGRSWAEGIEKGISNFGQFLAKGSDKSRSGGGIQSENFVSSAEFSPKPYITPMIANFEKCISSLNNITIQ